MAMNFELKITQSPRMVMTQELRQSIALLQLSLHELLDCIQEELAANPLLELEEGEGEGAELPEEERAEAAIAVGCREQLRGDETGADPGVIYDVFTDNYLDNDEHLPYLPLEPRYERKAGFLENCLSRGKTLYDHLVFQLRTLPLDGGKQRIGEYLIGNLDGNGYLQGDLEEHARHLGVPLREVQEALSLIQSFDPPGVGAGTVKECLLLQLRRHTGPPPGAELIIAHYLPELAAGKYRLIAQKLGISPGELQEALRFIRRLNPKPGSSFGDGAEAGFITPDIIVEKIDGRYVVTSSDFLPRLVVNSFYRRMLRQNGDENVRGFIKKNLEGALWFIRSVEHRKKVILQVAEEVVRIQEPFLEKGLPYLKPLTLKAVAAAIGVHESTVSRATANKYMQTPRGLFPLKFFFPGSVDGNGESLHSSASIKELLRRLIQNEDTAEPLSDCRLAELLCRQGVNISRRTVAKYREELEIPSSFRRRSLL